MLSFSLLQPEHPVLKTSGYLSAHLCKRKLHILWPSRTFANASVGLQNAQA